MLLFLLLYQRLNCRWRDDWKRCILPAHSKYLATKKNCKLIHSRGGENLFKGSAFGTAERASNKWFRELAYYHYPGTRNYVGCGDTFSKVGHLTQMMARRSTKLGCGKHLCSNKRTAIFTCHYKPSGNMAGAAVFGHDNFLHLCANEQGWKTCIPSLQAGCKLCKLPKHLFFSFLVGAFCKKNTFLHVFRGCKTNLLGFWELLEKFSCSIFSCCVTHFSDID